MKDSMSIWAMYAEGVVPIIAYGIYQYYKREKIHRALLQSIVAGGQPIPTSGFDTIRPALWRLLTIAVVETVLMVGVIWLVSIRSRILYGGDVVYIIAFFFLILFTFLMSIFLRDLRTYRNKRKL